MKEVVATESQLGRSKRNRWIIRSRLMKELTARGVRITAQRKLLVGIIQDSPRHLDAATVLRMAREKDANVDRATVYRTIGLLKPLELIDELDLMRLKGEKHYYEAKRSQDHSTWLAFGVGPSWNTQAWPSRN
jgi:Fe2+ or Zn2+ uptake regulation protein